MNREEILALADTIEAAGRFNMVWWWSWDDAPLTRGWGDEAEHGTANAILHNCNTAACFGGWQEARLLEAQGEGDVVGRDLDASVVGRSLGLTPEETEALFFPMRTKFKQGRYRVWEGIDDPYSIDAETAVRFLRELASGERTFYPE